MGKLSAGFRADAGQMRAVQDPEMIHTRAHHTCRHARTRATHADPQHRRACAPLTQMCACVCARARRPAKSRAHHARQRAHRHTCANERGTSPGTHTHACVRRYTHLIHSHEVAMHVRTDAHTPGPWTGTRVHLQTCTRGHRPTGTQTKPHMQARTHTHAHRHPRVHTWTGARELHHACLRRSARTCARDAHTHVLTHACARAESVPCSPHS